MSGTMLFRRLEPWSFLLLVGDPEGIAEVVPFNTGPRLERMLSVIDVTKL